MESFSINGRNIGFGHPVYIIAELSANHNHSYESAVELVRAAKDVGADAVKLQTYTADTLTIDSNAESFLIKDTLWNGRKLYDLYKEAYTPWDWQPKLQKLADCLGIHLFSTPFDITSLEFLESMDVPAYKIASFELNDIQLVTAIAQKKKPIIMSTGMATISEIEDSVSAIRAQGNKQIALLKCTSAYPAVPEEMNLRTIPHLSKTFGVEVGLSDHTLGYAVPVAAVSLGASIIEKHFTLSRKIPGPDSAFSLEPTEFRNMVDAIRVSERALGDVYYGISDREQKSRIFRRSLFAVADIHANEVFSASNVKSIRPGHGLPPKYLPQVLGRKASCTIPRGTPIGWHHLA